MDLKNSLIGYSPYSPNLEAPGDRRRFVFYAKEKGIKFEIANPKKKYDLLYITSSANLSLWVNYKKANPKTKLFFEMVDSYLLQKPSFVGYFRGISRFIKKKDNRLFLNYKNAFISIIKIADTVICSTILQKENIEKYNTNVHISLDYFENDLTKKKINYEIKKPIKIAWEGMALTVKNILILNNVFEKLQFDFELYIITDLKFKTIFFNKNTEIVLNKLKCKYKIIPWEKHSFSQYISDMDFAIIPINQKDTLAWNKPENKLLLLWQIGIPTIVSATPAYKNLMENIGIKYYCKNDIDWLNTINDTIEKTNIERKKDMDIIKFWMNENYDKQNVIKNWDKIFQS